MNARTHCTMCGEPRQLRYPGFGAHLVSHAHLRAILEWEVRHATRLHGPQGDFEAIRRRAIDAAFGRREAATP